MTLKFFLAVAAFLLASSVGVLTAGTTHAAIHEIVAAYCSGGDVGVIDEDGFLEPIPLNDFTGTSPSAGHALAKPVLASGAVVFPGPETGDTPNLKYDSGIDLTAPDALNQDSVDHPSAEHCPGADSLPDAP